MEVTEKNPNGDGAFEEGHSARPGDGAPKTGQAVCPENAVGLTLEETLDEIETILARLQQRDVPLEDSFSLYQQGIALLQQCNEKIDAVEKKMLMLNEDGELTSL